MTDQQINQAIADACGIVGKDQYGPLYQTEEGWVVDCPNYCTDLNAMHRAEHTLTSAQLLDYVALLFDACYEATLATSCQRAEAFLRTLGKWEPANKESLTAGATTEESSAVQSTSSGGSGGTSTYGCKGIGIAGAAWPPETRITVNGKTFCLADIDKEMTE